MHPDETVLVIANNEQTPLGWLGDVLVDRSLPVTTVRPAAGEPLPATITWRAIVILGGPMGAYEEDRHPFLSAEKEFMAAAVADRRPLLGICLGSQLLADALGGRAYPGPTIEAGFPTIRPTEAGRRDRIGRLLDGEVLAWHRDTWTPPPGATVLARSELYPQAFRLGSALGLQFHAELPAAGLEEWIRGDEPRLVAEGVPIEPILADARAKEAGRRALALRLFGAWVDAEIGAGGQAGGGRAGGAGRAGGDDTLGVATATEGSTRPTSDARPVGKREVRR